MSYSSLFRLMMRIYAFGFQLRQFVVSQEIFISAALFIADPSLRFEEKCKMGANEIEEMRELRNILFSVFDGKKISEFLADIKERRVADLFSVNETDDMGFAQKEELEAQNPDADLTIPEVIRYYLKFPSEQNERFCKEEFNPEEVIKDLSKKTHSYPNFMWFRDVEKEYEALVIEKKRERMKKNEEEGGEENDELDELINFLLSDNDDESADSDNKSESERGKSDKENYKDKPWLVSGKRGGPHARSFNEEEVRRRATDRNGKAQKRNEFASKSIMDIINVSYKADDLHKALSAMVYGQDNAISTFVSAFFQSEMMALLSDKRHQPRATFLFAGPPGTGKTYLAEQAAIALKLPFKRFDMSEYVDKESHIEFAGSDKVYKNGKEGNVTSYVSRTPKSLLLFDEIEKAHPNVINLFLQILDAGRIRDNFTDNEVSFEKSIVVFTTNVGKEMYEDLSIDLRSVSAKSVLRAISKEINPVTNAPAFPTAICSRFASGNIIMFNRLEPTDIFNIIENEINIGITQFGREVGLEVNVDKEVIVSLLLAQGGNIDARMAKGKGRSFLFTEIHSLFRLLLMGNAPISLAGIEKIKFKTEVEKGNPAYDFLHSKPKNPAIVFCSPEDAKIYKNMIKGVNVVFVSQIEDAKKALEKNTPLFVITDLKYGIKNAEKTMDIDDIQSEGRDFFDYVRRYYTSPIYALICGDEISDIEKHTLICHGAKGAVNFNGDKKLFTEQMENIVFNELFRKRLSELSDSNKVLTFKTRQHLSDDKTIAEITLFGFDLAVAVDAEDNQDILNDVKKPNVLFDDVIGAQNSKDELKYFINYLKNPARYLSQGVKSPKGILLYGPPGTGKTLLAKAVAGESGLTFISAEGNQFFKSAVGAGAEAVHSLFARARKYAPSVLFIDEIDAIAKSRLESSGIVDDVLTSFLTEMDGFKTDSTRPVFVLAATNIPPDKEQGVGLDPALVRRFDRRLFIDLPDKDERLLFIRKKVEKMPNSKISEPMMNNIASRSVRMSLAELDSVFELAMRNVIKSDSFNVTDEILEEAYEEFINGEEKKNSPDEVERIARHEAGHAVMAQLNGIEPAYVTIAARGTHGGYVEKSVDENKGNYTKKELLAEIDVALAGRAAEIVYYGEIDGLTTGASSDIRSATRLAQEMICAYGMDAEFGCVYINVDNSSETYGDVLRRANEIISRRLKKVISELASRRTVIDAIVEKLIDKTSINGQELKEFFDKA